MSAFLFIITFILAGLTGAKSTRCYGKYGCYSNKAPFNRIVLLPLPPWVVNPKFRLYTRLHPDTPQFIDDNDETKLQQSNYNGTKKTVLIVHGYVEIRPKWMEYIRDGLLRNFDCNVILVDWYTGSLPPYVQAAGNTRLVGVMIAELIKFLISKAQSSVELFHVVGFSLGSHIAGYCGTRLKQEGLILERITGLDPAGPLFSTTHPLVRLDPSDARFVDAIHTDGDRFGLYQTSGHLDFYPNGGLDQTGCASISNGILSPLLCDHFRATDYFIYSLSQQCMHSMKGFPCSDSNGFDRARCLQCKNGNCPDMGYNAEKYNDGSGKILGRHFLYTTKSVPFCVPYYTVITFKTSWSWLVGLFRARIVVKLIGSNGESDYMQLQSRSLKRGSDETFVMPGLKKLGALQKIQIQQKYLSWLLKWKLIKVTVMKPGWTGTQLDRSNTQSYSACFNAFVGSRGVLRNLQQGDVSC